MTVEERVAGLEATVGIVRDEVAELKGDVSDLHKLAVSIEVIAKETSNNSKKLDAIDERLNNVEAQPAKKYENYKEKIVTGIITGVIGALLGALISLVIK